eukprot:2048688-Prymnesium_polylepis.1
MAQDAERCEATVKHPEATAKRPEATTTKRPEATTTKRPEATANHQPPAPQATTGALKQSPTTGGALRAPERRRGAGGSRSATHTRAHLPPSPHARTSAALATRDTHAWHVTVCGRMARDSVWTHGT